MPTHFEELRTDVLHDLIQARPLATVVSLSSYGIDANHIPLSFSPAEGQHGILRGHIARSNSMSHEAVQDKEALAIFHGPDSYISPSWYPTKQDHGKVVPTWNYAVVHAYGVLKVIDDPAWLLLHLDALTTQHEMTFPKPWAVSDAPPDFMQKLLGAVVGIEIVITRLIGKWKISQNQPPKNQLGIVSGLKEGGGARKLEMAALVMKGVSMDNNSTDMNEQIKHYQSKLTFEIDSWDLKVALESDQNILVIDVRTPEAFQRDHISGAINIPHRMMNEEAMKHIDPAALIVTYCDGIGCNASTKGALNIAKLGFQVKELIGGLDWWKRDGHETEGTVCTDSTACGCG